MDHVVMRLADTILVAVTIPGEGNMWEVTVSDAMTGKHRKAKWDGKQMGAVAALLMGVGEDFPSIAHKLYEIAEPLMDDWEEVRCIP